MKMMVGLFFICFMVFNIAAAPIASAELLGSYHTAVFDADNKIIPWYSSNTGTAYDNYLDTLWEFLPDTNNVPEINDFPMYYFYCGVADNGDFTSPKQYENDWGERIPNFVEFGRLYYAYTGNRVALTTAKNMMDHALAHGMSAANSQWPNLFYGTGVSGSATITGQNNCWAQNDLLIDLAGDMAASCYKLYLFYGTAGYRTAAINSADTLAGKIQAGDATHSPWPYVVNSNGTVKSIYCTNWAGALELFDLLIEHGEPNAAAYTRARTTLKNWILNYPMQNGRWVDGHSDVEVIDGKVGGVDNLSNLSKSNLNLYLLDHPDIYQPIADHVSNLLNWTENHMIALTTPDGLYGSSGQYHGAYVPAEQTNFMWRMFYQTARQAAEYAGYYALTHNETYKDRAVRGFNYSTYMMSTEGKSEDGPLSGRSGCYTGFWFGDCYAEAPRMFFRGFMACPEWAPAGENHILYSHGIIQSATYAENSVSYTPTDGVNVTYSGQEGIEYLRLKFMPNSITANNVSLSLRTDLNGEGYTRRDLGNGDYAVAIKRMRAGTVIISGTGITPIPNTATSTKTNTRTATPTLTRTATRTQASTYTITPTSTQSPVVSPTQTRTATRTNTITPTRTNTRTCTVTRTSTRTRTQTPIRTATPTFTRTPILSVTPPWQTSTPTFRVSVWSGKDIIILPNPTEGKSVTIQFRTENAEPVEVLIHNVAGRLVSRIDASITSAGMQTVHYAADKLVNGVYVVNIRQAGKSLGVKRLVVKRAGK